MNAFDCFDVFSVIIVSYVCTLIAIYMLVLYDKRICVGLQVPDLLFVGYFFWAAMQKHPPLNVNQLGDIAMLLLYLSLRQMKRLNYNVVYLFILTICFVLSGIGYLQYVGILPLPSKEYRVTGPFYNPAPYGAMICILLSVITVVIIRCKGQKYLRSSCFIALFSIPALILSGSRAAWFSFFIVILLTIIQQYYYKLKEFSMATKKITGGCLFLLILFVCISLYHIRPDSIKGRVLIWKISFEMIQNAPFTGFGYNGFEANYMNYQAIYFKQFPMNDMERLLAGNVVSAYNELIRIAVEYGLIGLILYLGFVFYILFMIKKQNLVSQAAVIVILVYILFGLFSYPNRIFLLQVIFIIATACLLNNSSQIVFRLEFNRYIYLTIRFLILLSIILLISNLFRLHFAYIKYQSIFKNPPNDVALQLDKIEPILFGDVLFLQNYCIITYTAVEYETLLAKVNNAIELSPSNTLYRMKGDCLCWMNEFEKAE